MSEDFGPTFITLTDDEGNEHVLEFVDMLEYNGQTYQAFFPAETEGEDEDDPENGLVILKVIHENGEDLLSTLDTDEELDAVYELFRGSCSFDEDESGTRYIYILSYYPAGCVIGLFLTHISLYGMPDQVVVRRPPGCCLRLEVGSDKASWRQPTWP